MYFFWFRRDLRLEDNAALYHALKSGEKVVPIFIFDRNILSKLPDAADPRVTFIHQAVESLKLELQRTYQSDLKVFYGDPKEVWISLFKEYTIDAIYSNRDYEPNALQRDNQIEKVAKENGTSFVQYKDHVIFEKNEILKNDKTPYTVFTPYKKKWIEHFTSRVEDSNYYYAKSYPTLKYSKQFFKEQAPSPMIGMDVLGFEPSTYIFPSSQVLNGLIKTYDETRNFPAIVGTSRLGVHFRFGTISIREKARKAYFLNETFLSELVWRDFYAMILAHFPHVVDGPFRQKYSHIVFRNNEAEFEAWCAGKTGYPLVDAGMRELNATGYMHNRVRMVVASFLTKHLLIDWQWGEQYFADKLLDFDLASNNGGWQWAAGCGTDAAPYFRIFNPTSQQQKFDKSFGYIKKWIPEYGTTDYPEPMVDHKFARTRCLSVYKAALDQN